MTHDPAYKKLFSQPRLIEDLLKGFVPQPWVAELDFSTLEKLNVHFVTTPKLGWRQSDVIWRVKLRDQWLYVLILLEFQSSIDRWMPLRMWVYLGLLYLELLEQQHLCNGKLPPVLPIVLYNGAPRWQASTQLADLLETLPELKTYQPRFEFLLLDEGRYTEEDLRLPRNLVAALFRLEHCQEPADILEVLQEIIPAIQQHPELDNALLTWLKTLLVRVQFPEEQLIEIDHLYEVTSMLEERLRSWTERWKQEGFMQGVAQGLEKGLEQGLAQGIEKGLEQGLEQGIEKGIEKGMEKGLEKGMERGYLVGERQVYTRLARLRFGEETAHQLALWLDRIQDRERLEQIGDWLIQCESGGELVQRVQALLD